MIRPSRGQFDVVAVTPDAGEALEVRGPVLHAVGSFQKPIGMHGKGAVQTSSPFSPRTGWPSSFQTSTFSPSPRHCSSPRQTGSTGLPSAKHETMSVPPEIELSLHVGLHARVDVIEALRHQRAAGRGSRAARAACGMSIGAMPALAQASMYFRRGAEHVHARLGLARSRTARCRRARTASRRRAAASPRSPAH